jgi:hypothetical protein
MHKAHSAIPTLYYRRLDMKRMLFSCWVAAGLTVLAACSGNGGSSTEDTLIVNGDVPLAYVKRNVSVGLNPTDAANSAPGGDLMVREASSASAQEHNLTARFTQGVGDASDPEVSYDGKKIVFAMKCPTTINNQPNSAVIDGQAACTGRWNLWEYTLAESASVTQRLTTGTFKRLTSSSTDDDVDPVYLPANWGVIFSSNRQAKSSRNQALGRAYFAADEYERERVMNLHSLSADGSKIEQISFNQSHERNAVIRPNGDIMFARWEHVAERNRFAVFRAKPDGTDMFVLYGAHSPGNSYLHPRDMDPKGKYPGQLMSSLMPLSGTKEGGSLQLIDAARYSEQNTPASKSVPALGGQVSPTERSLSDGMGLSAFGRATTPYPLWDGSDRVLVAWRPCEVLRDKVVVSCTTLTPQELTRLQNTERSKAEQDADPLQDKAPAAYAIYMFDPAKQTWLIVAAPPTGFMYTDPVALVARTEPSVVQATTVDADLAARDLAVIEVRSVYDTDGLQRMAEGMFTVADKGAGCSATNPLIPLTAPADPADTRTQVADLARLKDPADAAYRCAPARFVRAVRGVPPPVGGMGVRQSIGETEFEQQQILGYAPIEPDGSFKLQVPADVPLALSVVDGEGRAIQTHTNWIQVRPGERRTCDGCHSPRRGAALNSGAVVNSLPAAIKRALSAQHQSGETLASLRTRLDPSALTLASNPVFTDMWADTTQAGVSARPAMAMRYSGNTNAADDLTTPAPVNGVINYADHIQPLWSKPRGPNGTNTCINCHADAAKLDLRATLAGSGRLVSYEKLLLGDPQIGANGLPVIRLRDGVPEVVRNTARVETSSGAAGTAGQTRKSRLGEVLWGQTLLADASTRTLYPTPPSGGLDHSTLLNKAEKRLLAEWMDLGGQYSNDPFDANGNVRVVQALSKDSFLSQVQPVLQAHCASCHQAGVGNPRNRFVLTGSEDGDFNVTLSMINNTCVAASNPLLARPSTVPHPSGALGALQQTTAVLPVGSAAYQQIADWIALGCPAR